MTLYDPQTKLNMIQFSSSSPVLSTFKFDTRYDKCGENQGKDDDKEEKTRTLNLEYTIWQRSACNVSLCYHNMWAACWDGVRDI